MGSQLWYSVTDYDVWLQKVCEVKGCLVRPTFNQRRIPPAIRCAEHRLLCNLVWLMSSKKRAKSKGARSKKKCTAASAGCFCHFEWFMFSLAHVVPDHGNADSLQHAAMHIRGTAVMVLVL